MIDEVLEGLSRSNDGSNDAAERAVGARVQALCARFPIYPRSADATMRCPFCGNEDTQVKDSRPTEDGGAIRRRRFCTALRPALHHHRARPVARTDRGQVGRPPRAVRPRQAGALDPHRAAQAPGPGGAHRAHRQRHRAPAGSVGRERHRQQADRRTGDGHAEGDRPGRRMSASPASTAISARRRTSRTSSARWARPT